MSPKRHRSLWSRLGNIGRRHRAVTKGSGVVFTRTAQADSLAPQNARAKSGAQRLSLSSGMRAQLANAGLLPGDKLKHVPRQLITSKPVLRGGRSAVRARKQSREAADRECR